MKAEEVLKMGKMDFTKEVGVYLIDYKTALEAVSLARKEEREKVFNELLFDKNLDSLRITPEAVEKIYVRVRLETAKEILKEIDTNFYYLFPVGKKPRVDMPMEWYDEIKNRFLAVKPLSANKGSGK